MSLRNLTSGLWSLHVNFWRPEGFFHCLPIISLSFSCQRYYHLAPALQFCILPENLFACTQAHLQTMLCRVMMINDYHLVNTSISYIHR